MENYEYIIFLYSSVIFPNMFWRKHYFCMDYGHCQCEDHGLVSIGKSKHVMSQTISPGKQMKYVASEFVFSVWTLRLHRCGLLERLC